MTRFQQIVALGVFGLLSAGLVRAQPSEEVQRLVRTKALSAAVIYPRRSAPATVVSLNDSRISAELAAQIESIPVQVGDIVQRDQVLVRLNCRDYELQQKRSQAVVNSALAQVALAEKQLRRARSLVKQNNVSKERLNLRETELAAARADLDSSRAQRAVDELNVSRCTIRAPFEGIVLEKLAGIGERTSIATPVIHLLDNRQLEVSAEVAVSQVDNLNAAGEVWFEAERVRYPLALRVIVPAVHTQARNREVRLVFAGEPALPGSGGRLVWQAPNPHVPASLLVRRDHQLGVFIANDAHARFVPLAQALEGQPAPIDLPLDSRLVIEGRHALRHGDPLDIQNH